MEHLVGMVAALGAVNDHVKSALPNAPVVADRPRRRRPAAGTDAVRRRAAALLRRAAARVEPRPVNVAGECRPAVP